MFGAAEEPKPAEEAPYDPKDPQHAKDLEQFPPDKQEMWNHKPEEDGWVHAHNQLREEIAAMKACLEKVKGRDLEDWEKASILSWWKGHHTVVYEHHSHEDNLFNPKLEERFKIPEKFADDHKSLENKMKDLDTMITAFAPGEAQNADELYKRWVEYEAMMTPHLLEEEKKSLPMMMLYFEPKTIAPMIQKILAEANPLALGGFIYFYCKNYGGTDGFRNGFMKMEGIPFFVWNIQFKGQMAKYEKEMVVHTDALLAGTPPVPAGGCACTIA